MSLVQLIFVYKHLFLIEIGFCLCRYILFGLYWETDNMRENENVITRHTLKHDQSSW